MANCVSAAVALLLAIVVLPGCQASGGAAGLGDVPQAAVSACSIRADDLWSAKRGTSVVNSAQTSTAAVGGNWQLQLGTGTHTSTCVVSPIGQVISISAGSPRVLRSFWGGRAYCIKTDAVSFNRMAKLLAACWHW